MIYGLGVVTLYATFEYQGETYYSDNYTIDFQIYKKTGTDNWLLEYPNEYDSKQCRIPANTNVYIEDIEVMAEEYDNLTTRNRSVWGQVTYVADGETYTGWIPCINKNVQEYRP